MNINYVSMDEAIYELRVGKPLIFSTDTVCGIGVSVKHAKSPKCLYRLKNRPLEKPIAWLVGGVEDLLHFGEDVPNYALKLAKDYWPGALTLVVRASSKVPCEYLSAQNKGKKPKTKSSQNANSQLFTQQTSYTKTPNTSTIGMRCPARSSILQLIQYLDSPLCTTSANFSGEQPCTNIEDIDENFLRDISVLKPELSQNRTSKLQQSQIASSVIDCTGLNPVILREGNIII